jgi:hypothetical protein
MDIMVYVLNDEYANTTFESELLSNILIISGIATLIDIMNT